MSTDSFSYVVADQYGTQSATVTVTIEAGGVAFVSANGDTAPTDKGVAVTINPLENDTFSAGLGPLRIKPGSVTTPSPSGTATINSDGVSILYTPASGFTGAATFNYTAQSTVDTTKQSTAQITVNVAEASTDRPKYPKAAVATLEVPEDYATLEAAYKAAKAGEHISLKNGSHAADFAWDRNFGTNPVVIKARGLSGATLTGRLNITGTGHHFHEVNFSYNSTTPTSTGGYGLTVSGCSYIYFTRCWFQGRHALTFKADTHHFWVGWCRFNGRANNYGKSCHLKVQLPNGNEWKTQADGPHHVYLYRNFFFDDDDQTPDTADRTQHIYFGDSIPNANVYGVVPECYVEENLIYWDGSGRGRARGYYCKRGLVLRYNHEMARPGDAGSTGLRHSEGGQIYGNTIDGVLTIGGGRSGTNPDGVTPRAAVIYGNAVGKTLKLQAGSYNGSATDKKVPTQAADRAQLAGNRKIGGGTLTIELGAHQANLDSSAAAGGTIDNVRIWDGGQSVKITANAGWYDAATCDTTPRTGWGSFPVTSPVTWTPSQVGHELADQR